MARALLASRLPGARAALDMATASSSSFSAGRVAVSVVAGPLTPRPVRMHVSMQARQCASRAGIPNRHWSRSWRLGCKGEDEDVEPETQMDLEFDIPDTIPEELVPDALKDLSLNKDGDLTDKDGKVINEFGATRFDVLVHAIRGDFDPEDPIKDTNSADNTGVIMESLIKFPARHTFQAVGKAASNPNFAEDVKTCVAEAVGADLDPDAVQVKERLGGKYVSVSVTVMVKSANFIKSTLDALGAIEGTQMKF